ncbi:class I SAM-dependent methyltransferase [Chachezhania sediminis]|uniref:class I SAM-dependent methyltransferase n=1 Tax=Chachezhania sediminis TaxID=2599291 RepID=UPI00131BBD32|nr:class I SAM-dependent methyltransferase [Chachezhania sediminis]
MSRLDSMLRRLAAQRDGLNWAAEQISGLPGDVLDLGLGNGRTYDHLREVLPDRRIWVVDRVLACHPSCVPPKEDYLEGEAEPMLDRLAATGTKVVLAHYDLGRGVKEEDVAEAARLSPALMRVMAPGGLVVSGQPLVGFSEVKAPDTIPPDRYLFYVAA